MQDLELAASEMREDIISMIAKAGSGHPGGSLSATDILCALYLGGVMDISAADAQSPTRDRFILSKGHAAPALYAVLAQAGFLPREELLSLRQIGSRLQGHPDMRLLPGVEASTGSLGQGLSIACGIALGLRLDGISSTVFTLMGDGECQEGQVWEAAMFAAHQGLDSVVAIVDHNGLQIDGKIQDVCSPESITEKFQAFGWSTSEVDGHSIPLLIEALKAAKEEHAGRPKLIVANTVKGKGVSFMEDQAGWHGKAPNPDETKVALDEIRVQRAERGLA
ncbi:MAG: transketolase [Eggerthellaceae bacterium]|nr:transketolase [Eggerthellaceae bacterium]